MSQFKRILGKSGIEVSAMGFGCCAIGGHFWRPMDRVRLMTGNLLKRFTGPMTWV